MERITKTKPGDDAASKKPNLQAAAVKALAEERRFESRVVSENVRELI